MKKKRALICFVGIDASGKSTQARALVETLAGKGIRSRYIYNRFIPILSKPFMSIGKLLFFRGKGKFENYQGYSAMRGKVFKNRPLSMIYQYFLLVDYWLQSFIRISPSMFRGCSIVCDRYIHDTLIDFAVDLAYSKEKLKTTLKRFFRIFPEPDIIYIIDVPEETAYQRKDDIPSIRFLQERRQLYLEIARECKMTVLDGTLSKEELESMIRMKLGEVMNWSN